MTTPPPQEPRRISQAGLDLIKRHEGLSLKAYLCPAKVWTIGYGSTGPHVTKGRQITIKGAEALLLKDLERFERGVESLVKVPLNEGQFSALVSFAFNVGLGNLGKSTLLRKLNASDYEGASKEFSRWVSGGGKVLPGLVIRRSTELAMFLGT